MVDINLIGDDQTQYEGEDKEKEYKPGYDSEVNEPTPRQYMSSEHIDETDYTRVISRGGSKKFIYIMVGCGIILMFIIGYFMTRSGRSKKATSEPIVTMTETEPIADTSSALSPTPETNLVSTPPLSPGLTAKIVKAYRGISTVSEILNTIPANVNFTLISYSDGTFLLDFLAPGDPDITIVSNQLQQNLASAEVNVLSKESRNINNRQFRKALVNGTVDFAQRAGNLTNPREPTYLNSTELQNQLSTICRQTGLTIKKFYTGLEKADGEFLILPVQFKAIGQKGSIAAFLQQLLTQNMNISFSKISLIADDFNLTDPNITVLLNIGLYRTI